MTLRHRISTFLISYRLELLVFVLALVARILYLELSIIHFGDLIGAIGGSDGYLVVAQNIIAGHGLSDSASAPYVPYSFRPPLFFYFIAWPELAL